MALLDQLSEDNDDHKMMVLLPPGDGTILDALAPVSMGMVLPEIFASGGVSRGRIVNAGGV